MVCGFVCLLCFLPRRTHFDGPVVGLCDQPTQSTSCAAEANLVLPSRPGGGCAESPQASIETIVQAAN